MNLFRLARAHGPIDFRTVRRDSLLLWMALLPLVFVLLFRLGLPWAAEILLTRYAFDLAPFQLLLVSYAFVVGTPTLYGVVIGFLLLDERDDGTLTALRVTPLPLSHYLAYRTLLPMVISLVVTVLSYQLTGLATLPGWQLWLVASMAAPLAPIFALFFAAFAANKVQGFALMKGSGGLLALPLLAYFVPTGWSWLFGLVPTFWPVKVYWLLDGGGGNAAVLVAAVGLAYELLLLVLLLRLFQRRLARGT